MSMNEHHNIFCHKKFWGYIFICQHAEGIHAYLLKCWRGTCSPLKMLKEYMVRERLGTPGLCK